MEKDESLSLSPSLFLSGAAKLVGFDVKRQTFTVQLGQTGSMPLWDCG